VGNGSLNQGTSHRENMLPAASTTPADSNHPVWGNDFNHEDLRVEMDGARERRL
jgi:hypothetical protein